MSKLYQEGPEDAKIVIVGEAPGNQEVREGRPFVGGAGQLLDQMLGRVGIRRRDCFVTNVCHTQPPGNDFAWFYKKQNLPLFLAGVLRLKADLERIKPNLVIALGAQPLRALTGKQGIDKWRGSIIESNLAKGLKVLPTYHPAYILRVYDYKAVAEFDLSKATRESTYPEIRRPKRDYLLDPQDTTLILQVASEMSKAEYLAVDIECWQRDDGSWELACVGFSDRPDRAMVLDARDKFKRLVIRQLVGSAVPKVMQNGTFDCTVLEQNGIVVKNFAWDTMIAHHALYPECASGGDEMTELAGKKRQSAFGKGLKFLTSFYTDEPYYKDDGKLWKETNDLQLFYKYNATDAAVTREIRDVQEADLREFGVRQVFDWSMQLVDPLMRATNRGIRIDLEARRRLTTFYEAECARLQALLDHLAGGPVNVKSTPQVQALLYDKLGLPAQRKRGTGRPTTDKDAINALAGKSKHPALHTILAIRERRDLLERYLYASIDSDGRMRCSFDLTGTRSRRLSSRQSIHGSGTNLQTIPEPLRSMFIPDEGKVFIYRDYSQAEARVVARLARCQGLIELFDDPTRDVHKENAARIFGKPVQDVTKTERYLAKRVVHASNYGMEAKRLVEIVNQDAESTGVRINERQAQDLLDRYFMIYPEIKNTFWREVADEIRYTRVLTSPFGAKRTFYGRFDDKLLRDGYSWKPQSCVGELGRLAIIEICKRVPKAEFLLNVHDSILVQCDNDPATIYEVAIGMEEAMKIPITIDGQSFYIPTDCKVGMNWANKSEDNPNGLEEYEPQAA